MLAAIDTAAKRVRRPGRVKRRGIPIPHEHGAWVILYAPMLIGLAVGRQRSLAPALLLVLAVTGAFLARNAAGLLLRGRDEDDTSIWLAVFSTLFALGSVPLIFQFHRIELMALAVLSAAAFGAHSALLVFQGRRRLDRSEWGELLGVAALSMAAPAGYVVAGGELGPRAWLLWVACFLYFGGPVFYVKMLLAAAKVRQALTGTERLQLARSTIIYHMLMMAAVAAAASGQNALPTALLVSAYLPAIVRALIGSARLSHRPPPLKRVGIAETLYAVWFTGCFVAFWLTGVAPH